MNWDRICAEIEAEPKLSAAEERALWSVWKLDEDERARKKLIACTLRFALGHAKSAARPGQRWEPGDLLGEATRALAGCLERWDGSGSFSGYASARVRGAIKDFLRRKADVLRTPADAPRVLSLDVPAGDDNDGVSLLDSQEAPDHWDSDSDNLTAMPGGLTQRERKALALTVLRLPMPGTPATAAREMGIPPDKVAALLRSALRKSAATGRA